MKETNVQMMDELKEKLNYTNNEKNDIQNTLGY